MLGDVLDDSPGNTVQGIAAKISKLHPQTKALFKEVENLIKPHHTSPYLSFIIGENIVNFLPPEDMVTHSKRLTHLALRHVHVHS